MKNASIYAVIVLCLFVLSWCSSINNDDFDKKVKCYELWRQRISDLEKDIIDRKGKETTDLYYINWVFFNDEYETCFIDYTYEYYNLDGKVSSYFIEDLLTSQSIISSMSSENDYYKMNFKIKDKKYLELYEE